MHPDLIRLGPLTIKSYGVCMAAAFLLVVWLARRASARSLQGLVPMDAVALMDWAVWALVGGMIGGRLLYVVTYWQMYLANPWELPAIWRGGLIWYGGFAGGLIGTWLFLRRHRYGFLRGVDQVIPFVAFGHAVGRIGCFLNGCCYGKPSHSWCAVWLPGGAEPVLPTQLFESFGLLALYLWLRRLQTPERLRRPGAVFGWYLVGYSALRWTLEWWRADQPIVWPGMTVQQVISLGLLALGIGMLVRRRGVPHL
ncbi:MAG: prolipoprotein diacylglyceryl transferase [Candidatus Omnitrophica bacterium]|nr:prolipoprotein diacylglyceryl transferase [Candidatus Omnitrophota bacterium]